MMKRGVVTRARPAGGPHPAPGDSIFFAPPLVVTEAEVDRLVERRARCRQGRPRRLAGRVKLITAHRILIGAGIAFFVFYAGLMLRDYLARGQVLDLVQVAAGSPSPSGFSSTYRRLRRWDR